MSSCTGASAAHRYPMSPGSGYHIRSAGSPARALTSRARVALIRGGTIQSSAAGFRPACVHVAPMTSTTAASSIKASCGGMETEVKGVHTITLRTRHPGPARRLTNTAAAPSPNTAREPVWRENGGSQRSAATISVVDMRFSLAIMSAAICSARKKDTPWTCPIANGTPVDPSSLCRRPAHESERSCSKLVAQTII
ncbi:hypothetical protein ABH944_004272 [Caballeronia udeis]|uniref:Uncharacterized protein n=1 Tax=Caballeronia udeis TaxID=1232866 RepID=A0ABW8MKZ9_9BURK